LSKAIGLYAGLTLSPSIATSGASGGNKVHDGYSTFSSFVLFKGKTQNKHVSRNKGSFFGQNVPAFACACTQAKRWFLLRKSRSIVPRGSKHRLSFWRFVCVLLAFTLAQRVSVAIFIENIQSWGHCSTLHTHSKTPVTYGVTAVRCILTQRLRSHMGSLQGAAYSLRDSGHIWGHCSALHTHSETAVTYGVTAVRCTLTQRLRSLMGSLQSAAYSLKTSCLTMGSLWFAAYSLTDYGHLQMCTEMYYPA
jgi:hypothetical protein